jgi:uncharacterized membrane protein YhaH (DUF805 family)
LLLYKIVGVVLYFCALPIFFMQLTIRRAHDFNMEGWIAVLMLVPIVNFLFAAIPGTRGDNDYGPAPEAESIGMKVAAVAMPILMIAAFLSAETHIPGQENSTGPAAAKPSTSLRPYTP